MACESVFLKMRAQYLTSDNIHYLNESLKGKWRSFCMEKEVFNVKHYFMMEALNFCILSANIFYHFLCPIGEHIGEGNGNPLEYSCLENLTGQRSLVGYSP